MSTMTSREFNHDVSAAKRAASTEPVIITDRGRPSHVLLSIDEYRRLIGEGRDIVVRLSMADDLDFEPAPVHVDLRDPGL